MLTKDIYKQYTDYCNEHDITPEDKEKLTEYLVMGLVSLMNNNLKDENRKLITVQLEDAVLMLFPDSDGLRVNFAKEKPIVKKDEPERYSATELF